MRRVAFVSSIPKANSPHYRRMRLCIRAGFPRIAPDVPLPPPFSTHFHSAHPEHFGGGPRLQIARTQTAVALLVQLLAAEAEPTKENRLRAVDTATAAARRIEDMAGCPFRYR